MCEFCITAYAVELGAGNLMDVHNELMQSMLLDGVPSELVQKVITAGDAITEWYRDRPSEEKQS